jgi:hypothetical protein
MRVRGLLSIVDRDLADAEAKSISTDWRFGIAYNAALKLCMMLLHASGYRAENTLQHYRTIQCLPVILGDKRTEDAAYLDDCRKKRNTVEYDKAGVTSETEAAELLVFTRKLRSEVLAWLKKNHPGLAP